MFTIPQSFSYTSVTNLQKTADGVECIVQFDHLPIPVPFHATPDDCMSHGVQIYNECMAGKYGEITPYVAPPEPTPTQIAQQKAMIIRQQRDELLAQSDWTQSADVPQETKNLWQPYRQALRDIPQQSTFPESVIYPSKPNQPITTGTMLA